VLDIDIFRCTPIAWSKIDLAYVFALCNLPTKSVLSAPKTNNKNVVRRHNDAKKQSANKLFDYDSPTFFVSPFKQYACLLSMGSEQAASDRGRARRGLASANEETRQRVARKGGIAPHQKRGLAAANSDTRLRVAKAGGEARANDREGLSEAGRRGGEVVKERYGAEFYREIGEKGGGAVKERYGAEFYSEIGKRGGDTVKQERGPEYYSTIGRKGGEARTTLEKPEVHQNQQQPPSDTTQTSTTNTQVSTTA
jgi:general stress protein YciG